MTNNSKSRMMSMTPIPTLSMLVVLPFICLAGLADALDLEFNSISCDTTLPAFAYDGDIQVTCYDEVNGGSRKRCSLGQQVLISGRLQYRDLLSYFPSSSSNGGGGDDDVYYADADTNSNKTIGYASANLTLATIEYGLFNSLPFNFCGDWGK